MKIYYHLTDGHHSGIGEAGFGPGVEREAVEQFSKGLIAGGNLGGEGTVGTYEGQNSTSHSSTLAAVTNFKTNSNSAVRLSDDISSETSHDNNDFALFRYLESTHNNKILYVPVPVQYQHMDKKSASKSTQSSSSSSVHTCSNRHHQSTIINSQGKGQGQGKGQIGRVLSFGLLELGFRSFGLLVGHFVLRKIVSADYNSQVRISGWYQMFVTSFLFICDNSAIE